MVKTTKNSGAAQVVPVTLIAKASQELEDEVKLELKKEDTSIASLLKE